MTRKEILETAESLVCNDREAAYGSPSANFKLIAMFWQLYLASRPKMDIDAKDVAMMMALLKIARIATGAHKDDNYIDGAGYFACGGEVAGKSEAPTEPIPYYRGKPISKEWRDARNDPPTNDDTVLVCLVNQRGEPYKYTIGAYGNKTWTWEYQNQPKNVVLNPALWQPINFIK